MTENDQEIIDSINDTEETVHDEPIEVEVDETDDTTEETDDVDSLKKKIQTLQAQKEHWRNKAKGSKVETPEKPVAKPVKNIELSYIDMVALNKANIEPDEVNEVAEFAKFKNISIAEALKTKTVQSILNDKREEKRIAEATNTTSKARGSSRVSDDQLLENARQGKMPETDADLQRLIDLQMAK